MKKIPLKETDPDLCLKVKVTILLDNGAVFYLFLPARDECCLISSASTVEVSSV